jgi:hypothetical protein
MTEPVVAGDNVGEDAKEPFSVRVIQKDLLPGIATGGEVIDRAREL